MTLFQYCIHDGCTWTGTWEGGNAGEDPALDHLRSNHDHEVRTGVADKHRESYEAQQDGENITVEEVGA